MAVTVTLSRSDSAVVERLPAYAATAARSTSSIETASVPPEATRLPPTTWTHPLADLSDGLKRQNDEFLAEMKAAAQLGLPPAL